MLSTDSRPGSSGLEKENLSIMKVNSKHPKFHVQQQGMAFPGFLQHALLLNLSENSTKSSTFVVRTSKDRCTVKHQRLSRIQFFVNECTLDAIVVFSGIGFIMKEVRTYRESESN